ncbi:hypothetical protein, partial [Paenibacillus nuruki]|uniref:hypothetical protein n=1 Tax=Paenibacillus nuruki TaxID=1886670 RepID=UPI001C30F7FC
INKHLSKHINSSNIFNRNQKRMLYSLKLSQKKQIYNFNNASLKQLIIISENLDISIVTDITKEKLIKNIFKALY